MAMDNWTDDHNLDGALAAAAPMIKDGKIVFSIMLLTLLGSDSWKVSV